MVGKSGKTSKIAAAVLLSVNFAVMLFCSILFATALWMISSPSTLSATVQGFGGPTVKALLSPQTLSVTLGLAMAALAIFFFFVAFMGFYGALGRSPFLLFMYATLIILLLLLECSLLYYFSSSLNEKGLLEQDGQWTHALRLAFRCCEYNTTLSQENMKLPWSCCGPEKYPDNCTAVALSNKNCNQVIPAWLHRYQTATPPPHKRSWHTGRVAPGIEPADDVLMVVLGRGRIGWMEQKP